MTLKTKNAGQRISLHFAFRFSIIGDTNSVTDNSLVEKKNKPQKKETMVLFS